MIERNRDERRAGVWVGPVVLSLLVFGLSAPALAVDGVIEINQTKAVAGGVTPGDTPGFPVDITQSGSYRLTSDLSVTPNLSGIWITADNVTLDLNGFAVACGGGGTADGVALIDVKNVEIKNGTVRGCSRDGIFTNLATKLVRVIGVRASDNGSEGMDLEGLGALVDGCTAANNGRWGIRATAGSLVINSVANGNTSFGLRMDTTVGYRSNVLTDNNGGNANAQVLNGLQLGSNVCGTDLVCP